MFDFAKLTDLVLESGGAAHTEAREQRLEQSVQTVVSVDVANDPL